MTILGLPTGRFVFHLETSTWDVGFQGTVYQVSACGETLQSNEETILIHVRIIVIL